MYRANIYEPHTYRHVTGRSIVSQQPDGVWSARTSYMVARIMHDGTQSLFSTGVYLDKVIEDEGSLRFKEKIVVTDSSSIDALLVLPL
jgi:anthranilate 1,2-dioxygenase small subunit